MIILLYIDSQGGTYLNNLEMPAQTVFEGRVAGKLRFQLFTHANFRKVGRLSNLEVARPLDKNVKGRRI